MAGDAAKKAAQRTRRVLLMYGGVALAATALHVGLRHFWWEQAIGVSAIINLLLYVLAYAGSLGFLYYAAQNGVENSYAFDVFAVAAASQLLYAVSDWGWYVLLLIPGAVLYFGGSTAWGWLQQYRMAAQLSQELDASAEAKPKRTKTQPGVKRQVVHR